MLLFQTILFSQTDNFTDDFAINISIPPCHNSDFERGSFSNWETFTGTLQKSGGVNLSSLTQNYNSALHQIVNSNTIDSYGNFPMGMCGNKSAKIGGILNGGRDVTMIKFTFIVDASNANFSFRYAMVLEDPVGHSPSEKPFFQYTVLKGDRSYFTNANQIITTQQFVADANNPFYTNIGNNRIVKDWSTECVNLSAYIGQKVSFLFLVADCNLGGHGAYAYIDCLCQDNNAVANITLNNNVYCEYQAIMLDGTASTNEDSYFISMAESDQYGNLVPNTEKSKWFIAQQAGITNITALANLIGFSFECNKYYKIKLSVKNDCTPWNEDSEIIYISCPKNIAPLKDVVMCCNKIHSVTFGNSNNPPNYTYHWESSPFAGLIPLNFTNNMSFTMTPTQSSNYTLAVTDANGCEALFTKRVLIERDFSVTVGITKVGCCSYKLEPSVQLIGGCFDEGFEKIKRNLLKYTWSDGYVGAVRTVSFSSATTLTLTVNNSCYSHNLAVNVPKSPIGGFPQVIAPSAMNLNSPIPLNRVLTISEFGLNAPNTGQPAYNATAYKLLIFDRWGDVIREIVDENCPVLQGSIVWDGKDGDGDRVQTEVYIWKLYLKNCTYNEWMPVCKVYGTDNSVGICNDYCFKWWPLPPHTECCGEWTDACAYGITVLQ